MEKENSLPERNPSYEAKDKETSKKVDFEIAERKSTISDKLDSIQKEISLDQTIDNATHGIRSNWEKQAENIKQQPKIFLIYKDLTPKTLIRTIKGSISPTKMDSFLACIFVDEMPQANWEHACRYIFVDEKNSETIKSTVPPSIQNDQQYADITNNIFPRP